MLHQSDTATSSSSPFQVPDMVRSNLLRQISSEGGFSYVTSFEAAVISEDLRAAEAAREMAWEQLHSGPWNEVGPVWRDAYAMACLYVAGIRAKSGDTDETMKILDLGVIMGGGMLRKELDDAIDWVRKAKNESFIEGDISFGHVDKLDLQKIVGRKYIRLYPATVSEDLYPHTESMLSNSSQVDLDDYKADEYPKAENLEFLDCILEEGEMLYIPPKWWHYVRSLSLSFSVSFWWSAAGYPPVVN